MWNNLRRKLKKSLNGGQLDVVASIIIPIISFLVASIAVSQGELMEGLLWAVLGLMFRISAGPHENEDQKEYR